MSGAESLRRNLRNEDEAIRLDTEANHRQLWCNEGEEMPAQQDEPMGDIMAARDVIVNPAPQQPATPPPLPPLPQNGWRNALISALVGGSLVAGGLGFYSYLTDEDNGVTDTDTRNTIRFVEDEEETP